MQTNYTIIGGGVIGLSIAYYLLKLNKQVTVFTANAKTTASLAAGGMLGGQNEFSEPSPLFDLALESRELHKTLATELHALTGIDVELLPTGLLKVAATEQDHAFLHKQYQFLQQQPGTPVYWRDACEVEPLLTNELGQALHITADHQVKARQLTKALAVAIQKLGATIINEQVQAVTANYITTLTTSYRYQHIIIAAGAWSQKLVPQLPMYPVKGECLMLKAQEMPKTTIFAADGCYIVPKKNNEILIGATSYPNQMNDGVTAGGIQSLLARAIAMMPSLKYAHIIETWCGIRPQTIDELPIIGPLSSNQYVCTGHYRNGILLSAITGKLVAQALTGDTLAQQRLAAFSPQRFKEGRMNAVND